jgi:hypothetical protein
MRTHPAWRVLALLLLARPAVAEEPRCKERCEAERVKVQRALESCLRSVDPRPPDRAAKMRLLCRERNAPPRCDGLPACAVKKAAKAPTPGVRLGAIVLSSTKDGAPLARPSFAAGSELFLRLDVEVTSRPSANRMWLQLNLRLLSVDKKATREVTRWDKYFEEQRFIDPAERGLPKQFTIHGGAKLPADLDAGAYQLEAEVKEAVAGLTQTGRAGFVVTKRAAR